ncbi:PCRF domain-containing protein, partial [Candidatus Parcubacteria bacterium]
MSNLGNEIMELQNKVEQAWQILDLDNLSSEVDTLEKQMNAADFWQNRARAEQISRRAADLKKQIAVWTELKEELVNLAEMEKLAGDEADAELSADVAQRLLSVRDKYRKLELQTLLNGEYDAGNAIISIHAGAGGTDAMDWAGMLWRMLDKFAESKNWSVDIIYQSLGEEAGYKSITFAVRGRFAYGYLQSEAGVHRLVRISPFDAEKMRHTSFALVEVLPELDELSEKKLEIDPKDLRIDTFMSSGKGGQSVNTTYSA